MALERFSAAWREQYVSSAEAHQNADAESACVFCSLAGQAIGAESGVVAFSEHAFVTLNAYPYGSGHLLVLPKRHVAQMSELTEVEFIDFSLLFRRAAGALEHSYHPEGMNVGMNLGLAAGAGIPKHLHAHVLPRWNGDTNFMTSIGETRVLPESLPTTWQKAVDGFRAIEEKTR